MSVATLVPQTFNDFNIQSTTFESKFLVSGLNEGRSLVVQPVDVPVPGSFPRTVSKNYLPLDFDLYVRIKNFTLTNKNLLLTVFDTRGPGGYLVVKDSADNYWKMFMQPVSAEAMKTGQSQTGDVWIVRLHAATPLWEATTETTGSYTVTSSGGSTTLNNAGSTKVFPTFTLQPNTIMNHADSWTKRRRIVIANRSELPYTDPVGDGWPVDVAQDAYDTDALNTLGLMRSDLNDLRLVLNGAEINRWLDPSTDNSTSKVWANLQLRARKTAVLMTAIASSASPANGGTITVDSLAGWPQAGFFIIDSECIQYTSRTATQLRGITRGARNTTAASHSASTTLYWVEHIFFDLIYDYTAATDPAPPTDRKPIIDLANSTNTQFQWSGPFLNAGDRRSAAWQPLWTDQGDLSKYLTLHDTGSGLVFSNLVPTNAKPNFNNMYIDVPSGISTASSGIAASVTGTFDLRLRCYAVDLGGNEILVASLSPSASSLAVTLTDVAFRARINAQHSAVAGNVLTDGGATTLSQTLESSLSFVNEVAEAQASMFWVRAASSGTKTLGVALYDDAGGVPGTPLTAFESVGLSGSMSTVIQAFTNPPRMQAGQRYHLVFIESVSGTGSVTVAIISRHVNAKQYLVAQMNTVLTQTPYAGVISDGLTEAQIDAPYNTTNVITTDNYILKLDSTRTPKIVFGAVEDMYLCNARITNETTGDYLDVYFRMAIGQSITIDCQNKRVTDNETGVDIPFAVTPSNAAEWISLQPGDNIISVTEPGVVNTSLGYAYKSARLA